MQAIHLTVRRGETVNLPIRVESGAWVYKTISAVAQSAPARLTATGHGMPDGWRAAVMNVKGPTELNAANNPPKDKDLRRSTVIDPNTVEFNEVNGAGFRPYVSGGQLAYRAPLNLSQFVSARMNVRNKVGGTLLLTLSTTDGTLLLDAVNQALWVKLTDDATAALTFKSGVFDIECVDAAGATTALCSADSTFTVLPEITTE